MIGIAEISGWLFGATALGLGVGLFVQLSRP